MYLPQHFEFAKGKIRTSKGIRIDGNSVRYTLINLIGLSKAKQHGFHFPIDIKSIVLNKIENAQNLKNIGDIGLLLWATSLISPEDLTLLLSKINFNTNLEEYNEVKNNNTMELAWLLTGLLFASTFNNSFKISIENLASDIYKKLRKNYGGNGIFRHTGNSSLEGILRGDIGTFADQVYSIYALVLYSKQKNSEEAILIAKECADTICKLQGENGEWFWQYNSNSGEVVNKFPIYSVNQFALGPMALFAIQLASKNDYSNNIFKSFSWLTEYNISNNNIIDWDNKVIWNKISPIINNKLSNLVNYSKIPSFNKKLKLDFESSSYEFGWILYTFAGRIKNSEDKISDKKNIASNNFQIYNFNNYTANLN
jgi:hypothetical protein